MGVVFLARDETLDRLVAVKVVAPALAGDERFRDRLLRESRLAARLDHPAIVPVYAAGEDDGRLYLAMRYVPDGTLADRIAAGPLEPAAAVALLAPVADGLDAAHAAGLIHRDVKPANILLDGDRALLADFGLARRAASVASASREQGLSGTLGYVAPEQIEGDHVDGRADQYALACVAYECLTGAAPFARDEDVATIYAHLSEDAPKASAAREELPGAVDAVLARALAKRPRDRFPSCAAFIAALRDALAHAQVVAAHRRRRPLLVACGAAAVMAVAVGAYAATRGSNAAPPTPGPDQLVVLRAADGRVADAIPAGPRPTAVAAAPDGVWVALAGVNQVVRIDRRTRQITERVATPDAVNGLAVGEGSVWATVDLKRQLLRIDPASGAVTSADIANGPGAVATTPGAVWVASRLDGTVTRFDPAQGTVTKVIPIGSGVTALLSAFGSVWATSESQGSVTRIDPATGEVGATINVGHSPVALAQAAGSLWIANRSDGTVSRVDPAGGRVVGLVRVGHAPGTLAAASGAVFVGDDDTGDVYRIDATTATARRIASIGATATGIAGAGNELLASTVGLPSSHRGGTLVVADSRELWSMDPAISDENPSTWVWDTLVRYRRASGTAGLQLVPDLAEALPQPTDGGRTYTFQVRRGIRYSTGVEVKPSDFVRAIDRLFRGHWTSPFRDGPYRPDEHDLLREIVGGDVCTDRPAACTLAKGVVADDGAGTITFHLAQPDSEFLRTLTHTPTAPVPPGTAADGAYARPVPGTGPYVMASQVRDKELTYRRNPYFRVWSPDARPDGNPDVIRWLLGVPGERQRQMVIAGTADGAFDLISAQETARLIRLYPNQMHLPNGYFNVAYWLDNHRFPLSSLDVRRAINYAVDRTAIAKEAPWYSVPSCQALIPGVRSFVPYCPYAAGGVAEGAPDVARARGLVRRAGAAGATVTLQIFPGDDDFFRRFGPMQRTLEATLREIGLHVVERHVDPSGDTADDSMISYAFSDADANDPNAVFQTFTGDCTAQDVRGGAFCPARVRAFRGQAAATTDPTELGRIWTAYDHYLADQAVWLPLGAAINTVFISKRAGNFGVQPASGGSLWDLVTVR